MITTPPPSPSISPPRTYPNSFVPKISCLDNLARRDCEFFGPITLAWVTNLNEIKLNSGDWPKEDFNLLLKRKNFGLQIIFMRNLYAKYYLVRKPQTNNHHAIHKEGCPFLPEKINRIYLGTYSCTANAITHGEKYYKNVRSCLFCLKESLEETNRIIRYKFDYYGIIAKSKTKEEIISVLQKLHIN